jgi:phage recombination protein Bet
MTTDALQISDPKQWLVAQGHSHAQLDLLRRFICPDASDGELMFFVLYCKQHALDPYCKQAYLLKTKQGPHVCLGIDAMRIRAAQSGEYAGQDEPIFEVEEKGGLLTCLITVYRFVQGQRVPFPGKVWWAESRGGTPIWNQRPRGMLEKCAEAKALRKGFPERCAGFYVPEEMEGQDAPARRQTATAVDLNARLKTKAAPVPQPIIDAEVMPDEIPPPAPAPADPSVPRMVEAFRAIGVNESAVLKHVKRESVQGITKDDFDKLRSWYADLTNEARE